MCHVSCGDLVHWNQLSKSPRLPIWAALKDAFLRNAETKARISSPLYVWHWGRSCRDTANLPCSRADLWPAGSSADAGKPCKEAAREEVPHSTSERRKRLMTGSADYLPLPPLSAVAPCQLQERMSDILTCDSAGAKRHHEALGPSHYLQLLLRAKVDSFLNVVFERQGFSKTSE